MDNGIIKVVYSSSGFIELTENEYEQIELARKNLFEVLFIEEKFDFVSENYYELETELLSIASRMIVFHDDDYFSMNQERNIISRKIANLMTTCRMYLDSVIHHLNNIYFDDTSKSEYIKNEKINQYNNSLGYRTLETLRNYVQHRGFPIQNALFSYEKVRLGNRSLQSNIVIPIINIKTLEEDGNFKRSVLKELKSLGSTKEIDIRIFIRDYIECIWNIHECTRKILSHDLIIWKKTIQNIIKRYDKVFGKNASRFLFYLATRNNKGCLEKEKTIFQDYIKRIEKYQRKNCLLNNLRKRYASNEIREEIEEQK